jgi:coproporphyrinogen III oxidase
LTQRQDSRKVISRASTTKNTAETSSSPIQHQEELEIFQRFFNFLLVKQGDIIAEIEDMEEEMEDGSFLEGNKKFTKDGWGIFSNLQEGDKIPKVGAGGITRVLQGGNVVEKGACSLTIIQNGVLSAERAAAIRARQPKDNDNDDSDDSDDKDDDFLIGAGDFYSAAALSIVLHSRSPMVPTFRSDVRIFLVQDVSSKKKNRPVMAWFGGGVSDSFVLLSISIQVKATIAHNCAQGKAISVSPCRVFCLIHVIYAGS